MPRIARAVAVGYPHHVIQRGNNREKVFFDREDKKQYLLLLKKYSEKWNSPVLAYCLMSNHVHILTRPASEESLYKMMQGVALCYTQYVNRKYHRTGRVWESRYHSCIVDHERYLWAVARYIEQNPIRARIVKEAGEYPYSSARAHIAGLEDAVLGEDIFNEDRRHGYIRLLRVNAPEAEMEDLRYHTRTGRPFGSEEFVSSIRKEIKKKFLPKTERKTSKEGRLNWDASLFLSISISLL